MAWTKGILLVLAALLLTACGGTTTAFAPVGMAEGQPTFLYLYSDN